MSSFTDVFSGSNIYSSDVSLLSLALTANTTIEWPISRGEGSTVAARIIEVTPTGAYAITLPDATLAGKGETILFNNLGPSTITIKDADGTTIATIADGEVWQVYLADNADVGGTWRVFEYGAGSSAVQAASLVGYGLKAVGATLAQSMTVNTFNTTYTIGAPDRSSLYVWTGAVGTLDLPSASSMGDDFFVAVRNGGTGNLTIDPSSTETINDATTLVLLPGDSVIVVTDGTEWFTVGLGQDAVFAFDFTSIDLTGQASPYTLSGSELNRIAYKFIGVLTANIEIVVPTTVQQYWVDNRTTGGSYTLSLKTATQVSAVGVTRNARGIYYCDGADVINADTASISTPIGISDGGTGGTTQASARTGIGGTAVGVAVFTAANEAAGRTAITAAKSGANTDITDLALSGAASIGGAFAANGGATLGNASGDALTINSNTADIPNGLNLTTGGLGLGTTPAVKVHANGAAIDEVARLQATASPYVSFYQGAGTLLGSVQGTTTQLAVIAAGARIVSFYTNGNERARIDSSGNFGVGNTNPAAPMDITTSSGAAGISLRGRSADNVSDFALKSNDGVTTYGQIQGRSTDLRFVASNTNTLTFYTSATLRLTIGATGDVAIAGSVLTLAGSQVALLASPTFTGTPAAPTAAPGTNTTQLATTAFVAALGALKADLASPTLTGTPAAPTAAQDTSTTQVATTAFVDRMRNIPRSTTATTAAIGDRGKCIAITANIDIPNAVFAAGDVISIYNNSAGVLTITQGASLTLRLAGSATTGNRTIAARGWATIWFNTASEGICSGPGVT